MKLFSAITFMRALYGQLVWILIIGYAYMTIYGPLKILNKTINSKMIKYEINTKWTILDLKIL